MPHIVTHYLPELDEPERSFIERLTAGMSHESIQQFAAAYRQVRKDPQTLRLMAIIGIVAVPGLHRFWVGHIAIGFLYLVTWGLLLFGTGTDDDEEEYLEKGINALLPPFLLLQV